MAELKEYLDAQLVLNKKLSAFWQTLLDSTEITYDEKEVAELVEQMKNQYVQYYNAYGMKLQDYLDYAGMTEEQFDKQLDTSVRNSRQRCPEEYCDRYDGCKGRRTGSYREGIPGRGRSGCGSRYI